MDLPRTCYPIQSGKLPCQVIQLPYWRLTFAGQFGISIWTDDPQRIDVIAPGSMRISDAVQWAKRRVPGDWCLVQAYRQGTR